MVIFVALPCSMTFSSALPHCTGYSFNSKPLSATHHGFVQCSVGWCLCVQTSWKTTLLFCTWLGKKIVILGSHACPPTPTNIVCRALRPTAPHQAVNDSPIHYVQQHCLFCSHLAGFIKLSFPSSITSVLGIAPFNSQKKSGMQISSSDTDLGTI